MAVSDYAFDGTVPQTVFILNQDKWIHFNVAIVYTRKEIQNNCSVAHIDCVLPGWFLWHIIRDKIKITVKMVGGFILA